MPREAPPPLLSHGNGPRARPARRPSRRRKASPAPGGPSRRGQIRRTMRPPRGRPSCRAGDLAAGHKGARMSRESRGGWRRPRGKPAARTKLRPPGHSPRPRAPAARSAKEPRGWRGPRGHPRERGGRETKGGSAGSGGVGGGSRRVVGVRHAPGNRRPRGLGLGRSGHPAGGSGRCPRCWRRGGPSGQEPRARGHSPQLAGALGSCHGNEGGGGVGSEVIAKSPCSVPAAVGWGVALTELLDLPPGLEEEETRNGGGGRGHVYTCVQGPNKDRWMRRTVARSKPHSRLCGTQAREALQPRGRMAVPPPPSAAAVTPTQVCCRHFFSVLRSQRHLLAPWPKLGRHLLLPPFTSQAPLSPGSPTSNSALGHSAAGLCCSGRYSDGQWGR